MAGNAQANFTLVDIDQNATDLIPIATIEGSEATGSGRWASFTIVGTDAVGVTPNPATSTDVYARWSGIAVPVHSARYVQVHYTINGAPFSGQQHRIFVRSSDQGFAGVNLTDSHLVQATPGPHSFILDLQSHSTTFSGTWTEFRWDPWNEDDLEVNAGKSITFDKIVWGNELGPVINAYYVATTRTDWTDPVAWSDGLPATTGASYYAAHNVVLETPSATATFPGMSLRLSAPQRMELMTTPPEVITITNLVLNGGEVAASTGSVEAAIDGQITVFTDSRVSGAADHSSDTRILARVSGASSLELAAPTQTIYIDHPANDFSGTWVVAGGTAEFASAGAVGAASIDVRSDAALRVLGDWNGWAEQATLTVADTASVDLGAFSWSVESLSLGASNVAAGLTYDAAELNAIAAHAVFSGNGTLQVGEPIIPPPPPKLLAHWPMDEGSGTTTLDASGRGHDGRLENGVSWGGDETRATFLAFDGVDGRVITGFFLDVIGADVDFTWAAWVNSQTAPRDGQQRNSIILGNRYPNMYDDLNFVKQTPTKLEVRVGGANQTLDYNDISANEWHHYAFVKSGTTLTYYLDGALTAERALTTFAPSATPFHIGGDPLGSSAEHFHGFIDDVALYDYALTSDHVMAVMNGTYEFGPQEQPVMDLATSGNDLIISWEEPGFVLQTKTNLTSGGWIDYPNGTASPVAVPASNETEFLRLIER